MIIPARRYTKQDSRRLEMNVAAVGEAMDRYNLTLTDILSGLRFKTQAEKWDEAVETAVDSCIFYDRYHEIDVDVTEAYYGSDD